jgi:hypothetical protein
MKTKVVLAIVAGMSLIFSSCEEFGEFITPSNNVTTQTRTVTGYSGLDVSHAFNVFVNFSETEESIIVEANENLHSIIVVEERNGMLTIKLKDGTHVRWGDVTLNVYITTGYLTEFDASGASDIILNDPLIAGDVVIDASGASTFKGELQADQVICDISGASDLDLTGTAGYMRLDASGGSTMKDYVFSVDWFDADLSGASDAYVTINERIDLQASGASDLHYRGSGQINSIDLSGASNIHRTD